jgi:ArsR family transcriptional regulator
MSIIIVEAFVRMRELIASNRDIAARVDKLERSHDRTVSVIEVLMDEIDGIARAVKNMKALPSSPDWKYGFDYLRRFDIRPYFCKYRNMTRIQVSKPADQVAKYADMLSAMGTEPRLRIMQLLLSAHPDGLVVGEIQEELDIPNSTLSHHLDKLRAEDLVHVKRESTFLRYRANVESLQELLQFLYAECCTRNKAVKPERIIQICK